MTPCLVNPFSFVPEWTPLASSTGTKVFGVGMEADSTLAHEAFLKEASMPCPKCAGLAVCSHSPLHYMSDYTIDSYDLQDQQNAAIHCLNCGYYADAVTLRNRAKQADAHHLVAQAEGWASTHSYNTTTKELQHHDSSEIARTTVFSQNAA